MAKCHDSAVMVLSHFEIAWFSIERAATHIVPFDLSTSPFFQFAFTPLKLIICFLLSMSFGNFLARNAPLLACYDSTLTL
jgi:hypothetical protein